jgi:hypothetical protein
VAGAGGFTPESGLAAGVTSLRAIAAEPPRFPTGERDLWYRPRGCVQRALFALNRP